PLERKLPLLIFAILFVVLAASLGISYYEIRRAAELSAADRVSSLAGQLAAMFQQQIAARVNALRRAAGDPAIAAALLNPDRSPGSEALQVLRVLRTPIDSSTPPQLLTRDGRPIGSVQLEAAGDAQ